MMRRIRIYYIIVILLFSLNLLGIASGEAPRVEWEKTFGGKNDFANSVQQISDGGYIFAYSTYTWVAGGGRQGEAWLIKTDSNGNIQWNKTLGKGQDAQSVQQTSDGGYIIAGSTYSAGESDAWLIKTDINGNQLWSKKFGGKYEDRAWSVRQTSDEGYIIAGETDSYTDSYDAWLIKTDSKGNQEWSKTFGGLKYDTARSVQQTSDGGYIVAGWTNSYGAGGDDAWLIKTDSKGNQEWSKTFGGTADDGASSVQQTSDGGYILAGSTKSYGAGESDAWLIKTDINGNQQWDKIFGGTRNDGTRSVQLTSDGGYILAGSIEDWSAWLIKTDANGNEQWNKTLGRTVNQAFYSVQQTSDGGYILAGFTVAGAWLVKLSPQLTPTYSPVLAGAPKIKVDIKNTYDVDWSNYLWEITQKSRYPIDVKIDVSVESPDQIDSVVLKFSGLEPSEIDAKPWKIASNHYSIPLKATNPFSMQEIVDTVIYLLSFKVQGTSLLPPTAPPIPDIRLTEAIIVYNNGSRYSTTLTSESVTGCAVFDADGCRLPTVGDAKIFGRLFNIGGTMVFSASPVDLLITDDQGRMTGSLYEDGVFTKETNEIPSSFYSGQGLDHQFIYLPEEGRYSIKVFGRGLGQYSLIAIPLFPSNQPTKIEGTIEPSTFKEYTLEFSSTGEVTLQEGKPPSRINVSLLLVIILFGILIYFLWRKGKKGRRKRQKKKSLR